jgi:predicted ribosome quality control (RQC) complex YloA/Tae2 family protein
MTKFRIYETSSGLIIQAGKNAENNDELVWNANPKEILLHTFEPGSPFVNIGETPSKNDIYEAATFCAKYSQIWRDSKKDVIVNKFQRSDMSKDKKAKSGSWTTKKQEKIKVKKSDILKLEKNLQDKEDIEYKNETDKKATNRKKWFKP